jgi:HK97 family phage prohead protease
MSDVHDRIRGLPTDEVRAKYSSDDLKDLAKSGKAMKNPDGDPSYPVADEADVKAAIKAVGRGSADHDAIRAHIMKGAKALGLSDLIPDNWNADGSLADAETKVSTMVPETREARAEESLSFGNTQSLVYAAICDALPFGQSDVWIVDCAPDWAVYHNYDSGCDMKVSFTMGDDGVTFDGPAVEVAAVTTFQPVGQTNDGEPEGEQRAAAADDAVACPTCSGTGAIKEGNVTCPDCGGDKTVTPAKAKELAGSDPRANRRARGTNRPRRQTRSLERMPEWRQTETRFETVESSGSDIILAGVPIAYSAPYSVRDMLGSFRETMHPGVATDVMGRSDFDCRFLLNHDGLPFARTLSGTLELEESDAGLRSIVHLDARQQAANDLAIAVERGDVSQMSCGFMVAEDDWSWAEDGIEERDVYSFDDLFDVSAVTYPASPTTSIELAQRMLERAGSESRERIRRLFAIGGAVRSASPLTQRDGEDLRAAAEALYKADGSPLSIRVELYAAATETMARCLREGKMLSDDNNTALQEALDALHTADDIDIPAITRALETIDAALDGGQAGLAHVLGKTNPDGDAADADPTLTAPSDAQARQRSQLALARARLALPR